MTELTDLAPSGPGATAPPAVRVRDAYVAFPSAAGTVMALRGADLTVQPGERLVVEGPNGSGKTTLLRVITGEQPVVAGLVEVGGVALPQLSAAGRRRWRARAVGFVDQHARRNLLPALGVLDNVALQLRLTGTPGPTAAARAQALLDELDLGALAGRGVGELSGGDAQCVGICAAVAHRPTLVLADEPTGELDDGAAARVYGLLTRIAAGGTSLVMVCHDTRARAFCDRGVRIRDGRLAETWRGRDGATAQVPDSRGWIRLPSRLLGDGPPSEVEAVEHPEGVLLRAPAVVPPRPVDPRTPLRPDRLHNAGSEVLRTTALSIGYPGRVLAAGLELRLAPGAWLTVTGGSGTGKSTLVGTVAGLIEPLSGELAVAVRAWPEARSDRAVRRAEVLAVLPQQPAVLEAMSVRENVQLAVAVRGRQLSGPEAAALLDELALAGLRDQPAGTLSGGERQRLGIARVLASDAPLMVLDEPTSQQDEASADLVVAALATAARRGAALLVTSHDPRCEAAADQVLRLGTPDP